MKEGEKGEEVVRGQTGQGKGTMRSKKGEEDVAVNDGKEKGEEEVRDETEKEEWKGKGEREHPCAGMAWRLGPSGLKGQKLK